MAAIEGVYIPGTGTPPGGWLGLAILALAVSGVAGHAALRIGARVRGGRHG